MAQDLLNDTFAFITFYYHIIVIKIYFSTSKMLARSIDTKSDTEVTTESTRSPSSIGDYKITGRDSLVFLVDASKEMFIKGEDGEPSNFDMTMQVRWLVIFFFC